MLRLRTYNPAAKQREEVANPGLRKLEILELQRKHCLDILGFGCEPLRFARWHLKLERVGNPTDISTQLVHTFDLEIRHSLLAIRLEHVADVLVAEDISSEGRRPPAP